jgi:hypothetical protein
MKQNRTGKERKKERKRIKKQVANNVQRRWEQDVPIS